MLPDNKVLHIAELIKKQVIYIRRNLNLGLLIMVDNSSKKAKQ